MSKIFSELVLFFFIYAEIGWLWETIYCSIKAKKFMYRGFLIGLYCPIYGFGILMVLYFIDPFQNNIFLLYILSTVVVTVLEYLTSYILEKLFHTTWWDYHKVPFNIQGRVALPVSIFWGLCCVIVVKFVHPLVDKFVENLYLSFGVILPVIIIFIMLLDTVVSVRKIFSFQKAVEKLNSKLEEQAKELKVSIETRIKDFNESLEFRNEKVMEKLKNKREEKNNQRREDIELHKLLFKLKFNERKMLNSFPKMKMKKVKIFDSLRNIMLKADKNK